MAVTIDSSRDGRSRLARARGRLSGPEWRRLLAMLGAIALLHLVGFGLLFLAAAGGYHVASTATFGVGTGVLAYTLGMRHAFDADHIAAIDNTTRSLMRDGRRPLGVGFFFSLGHSSVVFVLAVLLNFSIRALDRGIRADNSSLHHYAGLVGTSVSGAFLLAIAALNLAVLVAVAKVFVRLRHGAFDEYVLEDQLQRAGLLNRMFGPIVRRVDASWKMYPIGVLFGLGFDTATEVGLLVVAGTAVVGGLPFWAVLCLPVLFAAGMCLLDTLDGAFMNFAYGWAFSRPVRKVYYNLTITGLSVLAAVLIGTLELAQVLAGELGLRGAGWDAVQRFDLNEAGFVLAGGFGGVWLIALLVWRFGRIEERWGAAAVRTEQLDSAHAFD